MATARPVRKAAPSARKKVAPASKKTPTTTPPQRAAKPAAAPAPVKAGPAKSASSVSAPAKADKKKDKPEKVKVVRDSFTIPKHEYAQIAELKKRALGFGQEVKKSELIRAGLLLLASQNDAGLRKSLAAVPTLKTGRPGKG